MPAANSAEMAMPPRISRPIEPRLAPLHAIASTTATASSPNASAPTGSSAIFSGNASRISTAPKPAPRGDPDHVRRGERVGQRALQQRPRDAERGADQDRRERPRQPQLQHDLAQRPGVGAAEQRVDDVGRRHAHGAEGERGDEPRRERGRRDRHHGQRPQHGHPLRRNFVRTSRMIRPASV